MNNPKKVKISINCEPLGPEFLRLARRLHKIQAEPERVERLREEVHSTVRNLATSTKEVKALFAFSVLADLALQGWTFRIRGILLVAMPPDTDRETPESAKVAVRASHLLGRDAQLSEPSVESFVSSMETSRLTSTGWHSIFSLMRDGDEFSSRLDDVRATSSDEQKRLALESLIRPYIQFVDNNAVCEHTGLKLSDIWRYFRHTWVNEYKSVPGRSMSLLVRDAASPNHPVIGIAALGSSVVQNKIRDTWIGWHPDSEHWTTLFDSGPRTTEWVNLALHRLLDACWTDDLIKDGVITRRSLVSPVESDTTRLSHEADVCMRAHQREPQKASHKSTKNLTIDSDWSIISSTSLFRAKRCRYLEKLLRIKAVLHEGPDKDIDYTRARVQKALKQLVRMVKAEHVGVDMMDITVCGAIAPYNHLLGGKLVCLLMFSPEVVAKYHERYRRQISVIASGMKAGPVVRVPKLVLLCTTSLYGVGSSQYNRIRMPLSELGLSTASECLEYLELGKSEGYGTYHFSRMTLHLCELMCSRMRLGRRVNSIFGEGVNPLMRKLRQGLDAIGFPSDELLMHRNQRVNYGVSLSRNFREVLVGMADAPDYYLAGTADTSYTQRIVDYWKRRWLSRRVNRSDVIDRVREEKLTFPRRHRAMVRWNKPTDSESLLPF